MLDNTSSAKEMYDELVPIRQPYLDRARAAAKLTIPTLMPPDGQRGQTLDLPWQSIGARGLNNLASKMLLALMPPNTPFFKLQPSAALKEAAKQAGQGADTEIASVMADLENRVMDEIERNADRVAIFEAFKQLLIGNVLVYLPTDATAKVFKLDQYVVKRDTAGNPLRIIVKERISYLAVPERLREKAKAEADKYNSANGEVDIYTVVERQTEKTFRVYQEICDEKISETAGFMPLDSMAFLPLRWSRIDGEDYGRGFIEEYMGDLQSVDGLQKAIVEAAAAAARVVFLRNPNAQLQAQDLADAENGDVIDGLKDDVTTLQLEKFGDFKVALEAQARIEQRLSQAFLLVSSIQRNAERVTAEEIRLLAGELEDALGGVYSTLSLEFQLPYIRRKFAVMQAQGKLPAIPPGTAEPTIVTGMAALGRNHAAQRFIAWANTGKMILGEAEFARSINSERILKKLNTDMNAGAEDAVLTNQEKAAQAEAAARQERFNTLAPAVVQAAAKQQPQ